MLNNIYYLENPNNISTNRVINPESLTPLQIRAINLANNLTDFSEQLTNYNLAGFRFSEIRCLALERYIMNQQYVEFINTATPISEEIVNRLRQNNDILSFEHYDHLYWYHFSNMETTISSYNRCRDHAGPINVALANALDLGSVTDWPVISNILHLSENTLTESSRSDTYTGSTTSL